MSVDFDKLRTKVLELMNKGKSGNVGKELMDAFRKIDSSEFQTFGEIMRAAIIVDPAAFSEKAYILFDKMMRAKDPRKLSEFEMFFVQNFCKLPGEEFSVICDGWVETGKSVIKGQVFVSDLRIIATGVQEVKAARVSGGGMFAFLSMIQLGSYMYNKSIMDQISSSIAGGSGTMVNYGVMYPIKGGYDIEQEAKGFRAKQNDRVNYTVDVSYTDKKGKAEVADLHVSVVVNIKDSEIQAKLDKIEEILKANAKNGPETPSKAVKYIEKDSKVYPEVLTSQTKKPVSQAKPTEFSKGKTYENTRKIVLGVLKSFPRILISELAKYSGESIDSTRDMLFELIGDNLVSGRFDPVSDEFISAHAAAAAREIKSESPSLARCIYCGKSLERALISGDEITCPSCGMVNIG